MSTTATAQLDYYINLLIKNCNFDCLNSWEREGVRERRLRECGLTKQWAKYILLMTLEIAVERISWIPTRQECVCVSVLCVCLLLPTSTCQQNNYYFRSKHTHTHRQTLTKSDWKFRQDTERHRKLLPVVSKLEYTSGIVSKRVENSLLMSFNG